MSKIDQIKREMKAIKAQYKSKMDELYLEQLANCSIKLGDLVQIQNGTYGKPEVKTYLVSRFVFNLTRPPNIYGYRRLASGDTVFSRSETQLFLKGDETPTVIGHLDTWRQLTGKQSKAELDGGSKPSQELV